MFIQTEETPNPSSLKFVLENIIAPTSSFSFEKENKNTYSGFSNDIFNIAGVIRVFVLDNFITITKDEDFNWDTIKPQILSLIMDYISSDRKIIEVDPLSNSANNRVFESPIEEEIYNIIEDRVKPAVAMDGGDIEFVKFSQDDGIVYVSMHGSCSGCPSSGATLKDGIKRTLQYYVPEVMDVLQV